MKCLFTLAVCISVCYASAQQSREKWILTPLKKTTNGKGRLDLNYPDGVEWSVDVYNSSNKFITNRSFKDRRNAEDVMNYYELPAGTYKIKFNTIVIENVPIEQGKLTTLNTGVLVIPGNKWELRSEDNKKFFTSGNKPKNIALPAGKYTLVEEKNRRLVTVTGELLPAIDPSVTETAQWVAKPFVNIKPGNLKNSGRLNLVFSDSAASIGLAGLHVYNSATGYQKTVSTNSAEKFLELEPGVYRISWQGTYSKYDVRIIADHETSLKHGIFNVESASRWFIGVGPPSLSMCGPKRFAFPVGLGVSIWPAGSYVAGFVQTFNNIPESSNISANVGYLQSNSYFQMVDGDCFGHSTGGTITLIPGKYIIKVANVNREVEIKAGQTTMLQ